MLGTALTTLTQFLLFSGRFLILCVETATAPVTEEFVIMFTSATVFVSSYQLQGWKENKQLNLEYKITDFRKLPAKTFGTCHPSCMGKSKCHALSHIVDAIRQVESIEYLDAGCFESSQKSFEKFYPQTFKKSYFYGINVGTRNLWSKNGNFLRERYQTAWNNSCSIRSAMKNRTILVRTGNVIVTLQLKDAQGYLLEFKQRTICEQSLRDHLFQIFKTLGKTDFRPFRAIFWSYDVQKLSEQELSQTKITGCFIRILNLIYYSAHFQSSIR